MAAKLVPDPQRAFEIDPRANFPSSQGRLAERLGRRIERSDAVGEAQELSGPDAGSRGELEHIDPFTLLVAVVLSAQTTDGRVNLVTPALFARAATPAAASRPRRTTEISQPPAPSGCAACTFFTPSSGMP